MKRGSVQLNPNIKLRHVLYVSGLNCSLIHIAQLIEENTCDVTFTKKLCVIQDLISRSLIRVGEPRIGVYYLKTSPPASIQVNKVLSYYIWHHRLGHPSRQVLLNLSSINCHETKNDLCDVRVPKGQTNSKTFLS